MLAGDFQEIIQDLVAVLRSDALGMELHAVDGQDRKSTRLNSSHGYISYAVFCLKKKKNFHSNNGPSIKIMYYMLKLRIVTLIPDAIGSHVTMVPRKYQYTVLGRIRLLSTD